MTAKKTHWLRTSIIILLIFGIAGLALTSVRFFGNPTPTTASATVVFTFEGAVDGIAPNGTRFSISDIASEDVLSGALAETGLQDKYTVEQLRESLVARGVYPEDMAKQVKSYESLLDFTTSREATVTSFHPTTFNVVLYNTFDKSISRDQQEALMKAIMSAYTAYFTRTYANGLQKEDAVFTLDDYDYPQQLEIIQARLSRLNRYAKQMYQKKSTFRYNGYGFNDISVRLNNLINSDISRLSADLTMNALTRDTARLLTQYQFEIHDLNNQLEKQNERLERMDKLLSSYQKNEIIYLSTADSLNKIDGNSSTTYDSLVRRRKAVADGITQLNSDIATYQLKVGDLMRGEDDAASALGATAAAQADEASAADAGQSGIDTGDAQAIAEMSEEEIAEAAAEAERLAQSQVAALEKNIDALVEKSNAIADDFQAMLDEYNGQEINDLTVTVTRYDYDSPRVLSGAFIKAAIKTAGPICLIGFMLCMVLIIISRKREAKRLAKG